MRFFSRLLTFLLVLLAGRVVAQEGITLKCYTGSPSTVIVKQEMQRAAPAPASGSRTNCTAPFYVRVNVHYMLDANGGGNFTETDDGGSSSAADWNVAGRWDIPARWGQPLPDLAPDPNYNGYKFAEDVILACNARWQNNPQAPGSDKGVRFVLNGVYFHRDGQLWKYDPVNYYSSPDGACAQDQFDAYGVNKSTELNVMMMGQNISPGLDPNDPVWLYGTGCAGILGYAANNNWVKIGNVWRLHLINKLPSRNNAGAVPDAMAWLVNHELGHRFNLEHPYTPPNATLGSANGCNDIQTNINMMTSGNGGDALSPCQITYMQGYLDTAFTNYHTCQGCMPANAFFTMPEAVYAGPAVRRTCAILDGRASWAETSYSYTVKRIGFRTRVMYSSGTILGNVGEICLDNVVSFEPDYRYEVTLTVSNSCTTSTMTKSMDVVWISRPASASTNDNKVTDKELSLYPNPTTGSEFSLVSATPPTAMPVVHDSKGGPVAVEVVSQLHDEAGWHTVYKLQKQHAEGLYLIEAATTRKRAVLRLSVQP